MIGPADLIKAATNLQSHATSNVANVSQRAALAAVAGDLDGGGRDARRPSTAAAAPSTRMLNEIPGVTLPRARGRVLRLPRPSRACSAATSAATRPTTTTELAEVILDQAKVAIVPGEAFGAPGYARLSFALGDDDLVEGIDRRTRADLPPARGPR